MKEFQPQVISAKMSLPFNNLLIVINHLCPKNLILTLCEVNPEQSPTKLDKTQIDLTKVSTKGRLFCQEKKTSIWIKNKSQAIINLQKGKKEQLWTKD